ncbi:MAG: enoyl-CoA hydratase-related protein, partial [Bacteroidota bacterium]
RLPKIVPYGIVSELAYTGRNVDAKEAANIGLVNRTYVDRDAMMRAVNEVAATIASKAPMVIRGTKEVLQYTRDHTVEESLNFIGLYNAAYLLNDDIQEAMRAQMMRDKPTFTGS